MADIEISKNNNADILFSARSDCKIPDEVVDYCAKKFRNIYKYTGSRIADGWPHGPNSVALETYGHYYVSSASGMFDNCAMMFIESDCIPLKRNWIKNIQDEWYSDKMGGKHVLGPWLMAGDCGCEHINGNCLIGPEFLSIYRKFTLCPSNTAWDAFFSKEMMAVGCPSETIWSDYHYDTPRNPWKGSDYFWFPKKYKDAKNPLFGKELIPSWFHGIKSMRGEHEVRRKFKI
jgi:hypothetical protein